MIVLLDMDDVMADTSTYLLRALQDAYSPEALKLVQFVLYSSDFQLSIPPVPGSLESVAEIINRGHDVFFCSAPHKYYETCVKEKYQWIERMFVRAFVGKVMLTTLRHNTSLLFKIV